MGSQHKDAVRKVNKKLRMWMITMVPNYTGFKKTRNIKASAANLH